MSDNSFEIGGKKFKLNKIDAFKQFHIVRRIGPLLSDLIPAMKSAQGVKNLDNLSESERLDQIAGFAGPIMTGLSKLSDKDADFVLFGLLASVEVQQQAGNWAKIAVDGMMMVQDFELPILLNIAGRAFMFNIAGFFNTLQR